MKDDDQIIALMEVQGYRWGPHPLAEWHPHAECLFSPKNIPVEGGARFSSSRRDVMLLVAPKYLEDLNAMHEVEKVLNRAQWRSYHDMVCAVFEDSDLAETGAYETHATAAQRAEAFLKALNLWKSQ